MVERLNMGVIGAGFIGPVHMRSLASHFEIGVPYAVADSNAQKHEGLKSLGLKVYGSADELIRDSDIQAVHIAGPDGLHAEWALSAMKAPGKKVVVCEKPMTTSLDDALRVMEAADAFEARGGKFMVDLNYMGHALPRAVRELHTNGYFGKRDIMVLANYLQAWLLTNDKLSAKQKMDMGLPDTWNWRLEDDCAKRDILPHLITATYFMTGQYPVRLIAHSAVVVPERIIEKGTGADAFSKGTGAEQKKEYETRPCTSDLYTTVMVEFNTGAVGTYTVTQALPGRKNDWSIIVGGSQRSATWHQKNPNELIIGQSGDLAISPGDAQGKVYDPGNIGDVVIKNDGGDLVKMGCVDAAQYVSDPGEHPWGHRGAMGTQFAQAYLVGLGKKTKDQVVLPGATTGAMSVAVFDAVKESLAGGQQGSWVTVNYKGIDNMLSRGRL